MASAVATEVGITATVVQFLRFLNMMQHNKVIWSEPGLGAASFGFIHGGILIVDHMMVSAVMNPLPVSS